MVKELELFSLDGLNSLFKRHKAFVPEPGARCKNCDTELSGQFCHVCGQNADQHHRNIVHLVWEAIEGLFHLDGRLWRTLPPLFLRPGTLNRDYLEGRITRHVPPFRLFLVALLLFIFAAEHRIEHSMHAAQHPDTAHAEPGHAEAGHGEAAHAPAQAPHATSATGKKDTKVALFEPDRKGTGPMTEVEQDGTTTRSVALFAMTEDDAKYLGGMVAQSDIKPEWLKGAMVRALENPKHYFLLMFTWGHRLAVFLLPILGLVLALVNLRKRQFYIYDHLIVAMNLLSFVFLGFAVSLALPESVGLWVARIMAIGVPVNLFFTMRGAYNSSVFTSAVKALFVSILTGLCFATGMLAIMTVAIATI
ncbi:hypothetical protein ABAC460_20740 [Asticcacaulis sp. AC460]|uniref:DUF3667 domain-containing protein n=1 Tax=Asticcacaulis sp. AC460 TaxID=1282360 RepID=UPI0003C3CE64|nr:DUF3667 domain-containing protein [Asticcacaulis sp. AC460]ESQ87202.1 hypothetical protein ABAC460_20740 [Asticcacaulis sp. AC460]